MTPSEPTDPRPTAAVIGAGVAGLTAAYLLRHTHQVTVFEAQNRLGGHAHTHTVASTTGGDSGERLRIDSGFIVHNRRTYPHLVRLLDELGVATQPAEMSMGISCDGCGLAYAGGRGIKGILAQPRRVADPRFMRLLTDVPRFHRAARTLLDGADAGSLTWGEFLRGQRFSDYFVQHFALPLVACVWSCGAGDARDYPARHLFRFLDSHGMLQITGSPTWRTVTGGSGTYVDRLAARIGSIRQGDPVTAVTRHDDGVHLRTAAGAGVEVEVVVVATHADQALELLADASAEEKHDLATIRYSQNPTWLHRDSSVLPAAAARSSWNYRMPTCRGAASNTSGRSRATPNRAAPVSYWMNRLHGLSDRQDYIVTLNPEGWVDPASVIARMTYAHPIFTTEAVAGARRLRSAGGPRLAFAGAHLGWGFHEDGVRSAVAAAARFGGHW